MNDDYAAWFSDSSLIYGNDGRQLLLLVIR